MFLSNFAFQSTFNMETRADYSGDIQTIKKIMEESSKFLSLSGLSGIFAGLLAIGAGFIAKYLILISTQDISAIKTQLFALALIVLVLAFSESVFFSIRQARKLGHRIWTPVSRRLLMYLLIPLITGAFFILVLYLNNQWQLIVPSMLIFYGLALVSAGKFTSDEIFYLGVGELITGFLAAVWAGSPLLFWMLGFGFLHIVYGVLMYRKYKG
jgi:hypothetical protein